MDEHNALHSFAHADGGYHLMGCMLSAASCNKWWMDEILKTKDYAGEQKGITTLGENQVFYLPYLMGERSPHNNPDARAMFVGMSMDTTREDMTLAVLEGVAFGLRDSLEVARSLGIRIDSSRICGGGAKSPLWKKIIANILGIAYGGAVMMEEVRAGKLSLRDIKLVNQHIGISHSNLEDLTLVASIGGIWWVMLLSRWAGSFILVWGYRAEMTIRKKLLTLQTKTTL